MLPLSVAVGAELLDDAERRPFGHEARLVAVAAEGGDAAIKPAVMVAPGNAGAGAKGLGRVTGMTPGGYRRRFRIPDYALAGIKSGEPAKAGR
jgi:hypothetical protein